jgi:uncharacterized protein YbcI
VPLPGAGDDLSSDGMSYRGDIPTPQEDRLVGGRLNAAIVNSVVRIHHAHTGRGPNRAQAFFRENVVVVVMRNVMSRVQRSLVAGRHADIARLVQRQLHESMSDELTTTIGELTGCRVTCFLHGFDPVADMTSEVFVLDRPVPGSMQPNAAGNGQKKVAISDLLPDEGS